VVLHALEADKAAAWRFDAVNENAEPMSLAQTVFAQFVLNQAFSRFFQRLLHLADTHGAHAWVPCGFFNQQASEEM
jgi:hypothetical protein